MTKVSLGNASILITGDLALEGIRELQNDALRAEVLNKSATRPPSCVNDK